MLFFMFNQLELAEIIRFAGIDGIIYHHSLNCLPGKRDGNPGPG
jgi:hypothetical protein